MTNKLRFTNNRPAVAMLFATGLILSPGLFSSCSKQLDQQPLNSNTAAVQYTTPGGYKQVLAKVYGSYTLVSSSGAGNSDINVAGISDPATTDFLRSYWNAQELTTDEDICAWNDGFLQNFHNFNWTSANIYLTALYSRCLFQITVANEFIRNASEDAINSHGFSVSDIKEIRHYRAEARFLRAYQYWVLMDLFGNPPFVTEKDQIGKFFPKPLKKAELFGYIESELKAIDTSLAAPHQNEYGRADQAADWALLSRLYLNAEIYLGSGTKKYTEAITYSSKVLNAGYSLMQQYRNLFLSDNNLNNPEVILPIAYDASSAQNFGGTTFLICSSHSNVPADNAAYGIPGGGWKGNRSTKALPQQFGDYSGNGDKRAMFGPGTVEISDPITFDFGIAVYKFSNKTSAGTTPYSPNGVLCSTDFPLFRVAEMNLVYAEAVLRGGSGGDAGTALTYVNQLRERGYGNANNDLTSLTLQDILNERQRELYWEGFRRTDLIRYGLFTGNTFLWPWKGGVEAGTAVDAHFALFPIPSTEIISNPNLVQNPGY
ncbi:RagB/SusD family nutrient uptake outer membrane protein [Flavitalea flava]